MMSDYEQFLLSADEESSGSIEMEFSDEEEHIRAPTNVNQQSRKELGKSTIIGKPSLQDGVENDLESIFYSARSLIDKGDIDGAKIELQSVDKLRVYDFWYSHLDFASKSARYDTSNLESCQSTLLGIVSVFCEIVDQNKELCLNKFKKHFDQIVSRLFPQALKSFILTESDYHVLAKEKETYIVMKSALHSKCFEDTFDDLALRFLIHDTIRDRGPFKKIYAEHYPSSALPQPKKNITLLELFLVEFFQFGSIRQLNLFAEIFQIASVEPYAEYTVYRNNIISEIIILLSSVVNYITSTQRWTTQYVLDLHQDLWKSLTALEEVGYLTMHETRLSNLLQFLISAITVTNLILYMSKEDKGLIDPFGHEVMRVVISTDVVKNCMLYYESCKKLDLQSMFKLLERVPTISSMINSLNTRLIELVREKMLTRIQNVYSTISLTDVCDMLSVKDCSTFSRDDLIQKFVGYRLGNSCIEFKLDLINDLVCFERLPSNRNTHSIVPCFPMTHELPPHLDKVRQMAQRADDSEINDLDKYQSSAFFASLKQQFNTNDNPMTNKMVNYGRILDIMDLIGM